MNHIGSVVLHVPDDHPALWVLVEPEEVVAVCRSKRSKRSEKVWHAFDHIDFADKLKGKPFSILDC